MADITPVTREEFYLAKAGGQDVPVPSAVTREEYYLEKLSNGSVVVPSPVTRREKFLYFACGGEIDLPSEEKMTRLERLIAKAGGMDLSTPTAVTRLEKLWANVEGGGWKTITGVLPLTFTAKGGTAVDWEIRGNDESYQMLPDSTGQQVITCDAGTTVSTGITDLISLDTGSYTIHYYQMTSMTSNTRNTLSILSNATGTQNYESGSPNHNLNAGWYSWTFDISTAGYYQLRIWINTPSDETKATNFILTKGETTAPDHYIPYQQGVGERTVNLFDISTVVDGYINANGVLTAGTQLQGEKTSDYIEIDSSTAYTISAVGGFPSLTGYQGWRSIAYYDSNKSFLARTASQGTSDLSATSGSTAKYVRISYRSFGVANLQIMLVQGSTAPSTYVPYGYEIPITVSQQGQTDKNYDIYIGSTPLTTGQSISKTSTGVDIELFNGENTVSTTLYNKPAMKIKYK